MSKEEFAKIIVTIKAAWPNSSPVPDEMSKSFWYEKLKGMKFERLYDLICRYVENHRFPPSIAEIYEIYYGEARASWCGEWIRLLNGAKSKELKEPGQFALRMLTREYFECCLDNPRLLAGCMKEFERLYKEFAAMDAEEKGKLREACLFRLPAKDGGKS